MIRLFTSVFPETSPLRRAEYAECLTRNIACRSIDEICLAIENGATVPPSGRIRQRQVALRPTYSMFFDWIREIAQVGDISIVANADIFFTDDIGVLKHWAFPRQTALALSRWERRPGGGVALNHRNDSQDVWVFRGPVEGVMGDFPVGAVRCDNRIAYELGRAGYQVLNPSFSVRAFHLHAGENRNYDVVTRDDFVPPPYAYVWPHNLWSLPRTIRHNIRHRDVTVAWRLDTRLIRAVLRLSRARKGLEMVLAATGIRRHPDRP